MANPPARPPLPRGDVARSYGTVIDRVDEGEATVTVTTTSGRSLTADLLVIAEGVRSSTRDRLFGDLVDRRELGVTMVFGTIARTPDDDRRWRWHNAIGGRQTHLRSDNHGTTRAILAYTAGDDLVDVQGLPPWINHFAFPQPALGRRLRGLLDKALSSAVFEPVAAKLDPGGRDRAGAVGPGRGSLSCTAPATDEGLSRLE